MNIIKKRREEKNLSQRYVANKLKITPGALSNYETYKRCPSLNILQNISDYLEIPLDALINDLNINKTEY